MGKTERKGTRFFLKKIEISIFINQEAWKTLVWSSKF